MATAKKSATKCVLKKAATSADKVDEQLVRYRDMRDFDVTAEPSGAEKKKFAAKNTASWSRGEGLPFVIQKHAASHLHYDFRLGWNGVLKSWACAKGPSYVTKDRRLAVEVEDHPMEYGGFEGIIPRGQYGGGTVIVWDQGTWAPQPGYEDVDKGLRDGSLKFTMNGSKMHGKWTLVRMNSGGAKEGRWRSSSKPNWLLIKEHDDFERGPEDPAVTDAEPNSSVTGRTMEEVANQQDHVWNSKETGSPEAWYRQETQAKSSPPVKPAKRAAKTPATQVAGVSLTSLPKEKQPDFLGPQLAQEIDTPPSGAGWLHELKLDGYRIQARKSGGKVALLTRSGLDWTHRVKPIADAIAALPVSDVTLDGEAVVLTEEGTTSFAMLQASFQEGARHPLTFFAFDLLHIDGHNPRALPLEERKQLLANILQQTGHHDIVRLSEHIKGSGEDIFHRACELHAEGIVSKRADAPYRAGRGGEWVKAKCLHEQEFVIGGYTSSTEGPGKIGSLLLGFYDGAKLIYAGRTGTGFTQKTKRSLHEQLHKLETNTPAFASVPAEARRGVRWVHPRLVAQVRFATWTADNLVRQAAFLGLREDKPASEVLREEAGGAPKPKAAKAAKSNPAKTVADRPSATKASKQLPPIRLTHPDKVLDPESGVTKAQLAAYYWAIAERMLPNIADRPLSLVRCPEGAGKPCFYQKHVNHMLPPGVTAVDVPDRKTGKLEPYITLNTPEALAGLAQMGVLEVHPWGSTNTDLEHPDRIIFDLDPDESLPWPTLCEAAAEVRALLKRAGLESFLKTTGGKGLHVVAPIGPTLTWTELKTAAHSFVTKMERAKPSLYLTRMTKAARKGKIYLDYLRNERGATAVAPLSPRARLGMNVSMPLPWSALSDRERPRYAISNFTEWQSLLRSDPWKAMPALHQQLDIAKLSSL